MRQQGQYADSGMSAYVQNQMQQMSDQRMEHRPGHFQGRPQAFSSEQEHPYVTSKHDEQWSWDREDSKISSPMSPSMLGQEGNAPRSFYQGQRPDANIGFEKQGNSNPRSQLREGDMDNGYGEKPSSQTFEGLEEKFLNDIRKLSKEQSDVEDAENARHGEKISAINIQYQEHLATLRARHASRKEAFLRRESQARQQQFQQAMIDQYTSTSNNNSNMMGMSDPRQGYGGNVAASASSGEAHQTFNNNDQYVSYKERARYLGNAREDHHGFEQRGPPYPGGRTYDTGSRYY